MEKMESVLIFLLGFVSCAFMFYVFSYGGVEVPFVDGVLSYDVEAPSDWVSEDDIVVFDDMVVLRVGGVSLSSYATTGSMKPLFDKGANGIRVVPESADDVSVGDIVSYRRDGILIVHRVVEKGVDGEGVYFVMKGDNNVFSDERVRFEDIEFVTIGIIF